MHFCLPPTLAFLLVFCLPQAVQAANRCMGGAKDYRSAIYARPFKKELHLRDNECLAELVIGNWCEWEPVEIGHAVTVCQKGLNIRWRRRLCNCPPPKPLHSSQTWCRPEWNASSVARLRSDTLTRLEALKPAVWNDDKLWSLSQPFSRPGSLTNSQLACMQLDECFFHTGAFYSGSVNHDRQGLPCLPWKDFLTTLTSYGMSNKKANEFLATKPQSFCRNPLAELDHTHFSNSRLKPWCFIRHHESGIQQKWDYCDIRRCGSSHFHGTVYYDRNKFGPIELRSIMKSATVTPNNLIDPDPAGDLNAESCFESCRFRCEKFARKIQK